MRHVKLFAALALVGVFVLGAATGSGLTFVSIGHRMHRMMAGPPEEAEARALVFAMNRELRLTDTQRLQVRNALLRHRPEMNAIRRTIEPQLKEVRDKQREEIRGVLTAEQQTKYDLLNTRFETRRKLSLGM